MTPTAATVDARVGWRRLWHVAQWALVAVMLVVLVRRIVPDLRLPDLGPVPDGSYAVVGGGTDGPAAYRGRVVVVNVWATWCPPCVAETPGFVRLQREFGADVRFLGLSRDDTPADVRAFVARHDVPYPVLMGPAVGGAGLAADVLPTTYVVDRAGRVRMRHEGILLASALRPALRTLVRESP